MGFFSWITQDTHSSIPNKFSGLGTFRVIMQDDKGNQYVEDNYEGYGVFGGKDYFELMDEMNGGTGDRSRAISLYYSGEEGIKFPSLTERGGYLIDKPEDCDAQGYFYSEEEDEDEEDYDYYEEEDEEDEF